VTGWTFERVGSMDFVKASELFTYWADYPPTHLLLRMYVGYKRETGPSEIELKMLNTGPVLEQKNIPQYAQDFLKNLDKVKRVE